MKKLSFIIAAAMLLAAFAGCNKAQDTTPDETLPEIDVENNKPSDAQEPEKIDAPDEVEEETEPEAAEDAEVEDPETTFEIVADGKLDITITDPDEIVVLKAKIINNGDTPADFQWYRCDKNGAPLEESPLEMTETLTINGIPANEAGVARYYIARAIIGNTTKELVFSVVLVSEQEEQTEFNVVSADGQYEYKLYSHEETVTLEVKLEYDGKESVSYEWYRCDSYGKHINESSSGLPIGVSEKFEVSGVAHDEIMIPRHYVCTVTVGEVKKDVFFSVTLQPMSVEIEDGLVKDFDLVSIDGQYEYTIYEADKEFTMKVVAVDTTGYLKKFWSVDQNMYYLDYYWIRCDENGNPLDKNAPPVGWVDTCTIKIPAEETGIPRYYLATSAINNISKSVLFKVTLVSHDSNS